jgi:hypothetical protein
VTAHVPTTDALSGSRLAWEAHPARDHVGRAIAGLVVIAAFAGLTAIVMGASAWGILAAIILVGVVNRFYFPSRFEIDDEGITVQYPLRRRRVPWSAIRRFGHDDEAGYLSRRAAASRFDFGGLPVHFGREGRGAIDRIRAYVRAAGAAATSPDAGAAAKEGARAWDR